MAPSELILEISSRPIQYKNFLALGQEKLNYVLFSLC